MQDVNCRLLVPSSFLKNILVIKRHWNVMRYLKIVCGKRLRFLHRVNKTHLTYCD